MNEEKFKRLCKQAVAKILDTYPKETLIDPLGIRDLIRAFAMGVVSAYGDENDSERRTWNFASTSFRYKATIGVQMDRGVL